MEDKNASAKENSGMALAGMIISVVGLICAFLPSWRGFGIISAAVGLLVCAFSFSKSKREGAKKTRALIGIWSAIVAIIVGIFFLYVKPEVTREQNRPEEEIPAELKDSSVLGTDHTNALEKLQGLTDSTNADH